MTQIEICESLSEEARSPLVKWADGKPLTLVCDENTYAAAGEVLERETGSSCFTFYTSPQADTKALKALNAVSNNALLVAVGSGAINDLCKYTAYQRKQPYACIPTALSMNGYLSSTASIANNDGVKETLNAKPPTLLLAFMDVLEAAPARLNRAGLGDSICRTTAQFDWLLSHLTQGTEYDALPFEWLAEHEAVLLEDGVATLEPLLRTLLASGRGMAHVGSSAPASQAEHMIAHAMHALYPDACKGLLHGEEIAVTTLIVSRMHETLIGRGALSQGITEQLRQVHLAPDYLESVLEKSGCPTNPADLGWTDAMLAEAIALAPQMRDRYTVLNLV